MTQRASLVFAVLVSMAIGMFASKTLPLSTLPKTLAVGLICAAAFWMVAAVTRPNRTANNSDSNCPIPPQ
jgi:hypothetical protein